jgi:signal transduction histidine kinase
MNSGSLRFRLLVAAAVSILAALALAAAGLAWLFERHVERWLDAELEIQLNQLVAGLRASSTGLIESGNAPADPRFSAPLSGLYWQVRIEPGGQVLRSRSLWDYELKLPSLEVDDRLHHSRLTGPGGSTLYVLQRRVRLPQGLGGGTAQAAVGLDAGELRAAVWRFAGALVPFLFLICVLLVAASWVQVGVGLRPLDAMRKALGDIRSGRRRRLGSGFPKEVQPLASEIDGLLDARDAQVEKARQRAADLAHGLKTPLQVLAGETERLRSNGAAQAAGNIEDIAAMMQRHIDRHLTRTRIAPPSHRAAANIGDVIDRVVGVVRRTPYGARLDWSVAVRGALHARIDRDDLAEALGNLVENAARHACSRVEVTAARKGDMVELTVGDDGPGIPKAKREKALRRGERLDAPGSGAGLGLAIVLDIAEAYGARLSFEEDAPGLCATLSVPLATPEPPPQA